jgi:hypothetical protein
MKLVKALALVIVALVITNVTLTNRAVDQSVTVSTYNEEIETLNHENALLNAAIAEAGSLTKLRVLIENAGFIESPKVVSLQATSSVASR